MPTNSSSSSARAASGPLTAPALSCPHENERSGATTFSSTVMSRNRRVIWNVRPIPMWARAQGRIPSTRRPSNHTSPALGRIMPSMRLNAVVLPEPLGPMSAVIDPSGTVNEQPSTARTPPKRFSSPFTSSSARPAWTSWPTGASSRSRMTSGLSRRAPTIASSPRRRRLSSRSPTNGTIPCGMKSTTSAMSPPKMSRRVLPPPCDWFASSLSGSMMNAPHRPPQRPAAAEQHRQDDLHRDDDVEHPARVDEVEVVGVDAARHRQEHRPRDEAEDLVRRRGDPDRRGLVLVLAHRDQAHAELRPADPPRHEDRQRQQRDERVVEGPVLDRRVEQRERQRQPLRALRERRPVEEHELREQQERDRQDHERVAARAHRDHAQERRERRADDARERDPHERRDRRVADRDQADRVRADPEERALAERDVAAIARDHVQPHGADREDEREDRHVLVEAVGDDDREQHEREPDGDDDPAPRPARQQARGTPGTLAGCGRGRGAAHTAATSSRSRSPSSPCGRPSSTMKIST